MVAVAILITARVICKAKEEQQEILDKLQTCEKKNYQKASATWLISRRVMDGVPCAVPLAE